MTSYTYADIEAWIPKVIAADRTVKIIKPEVFHADYAVKQCTTVTCQADIDYLVQARKCQATTRQELYEAEHIRRKLLECIYKAILSWYVETVSITYEKQVIVFSAPGPQCLLGKVNDKTVVRIKITS